MAHIEIACNANGLDDNFKLVDYEGKFYRIQLWDVAGQDRSAKIIRSFAKGSHGCVVLCDATNVSTRDE